MEGILHLLDRQTVQQWRVGIGVPVVLVGVFLRLVEDLEDVRVLLQPSADVVTLNVGGVLAGFAVAGLAGARRVLGAQEDRDLDLVVPAALDPVDLLKGHHR